nr:hypothetical protein Iba_chr14aCG13130 [Ipomoea batatas]
MLHKSTMQTGISQPHQHPINPKPKTQQKEPTTRHDSHFNRQKCYSTIS